MRTKSFLLGFIFIVALTVVFIIFGDHRQNFKTLVSETHRQLKDNIKTIKDHLDGKADERRLAADEKHLALVGLGRGAAGSALPTLPGDPPAVVSYAADGDVDQAVGLVGNIARVLPNHTLLLYSVGLARRDLNLLQNHCNSSHCWVVEFDLSLFPPHVSDRRLHAFRPLIIQDGLRRAGSVLFLEAHQRVAVPGPALLEALVPGVGAGVMAWGDEAFAVPVTSLTHPHMFKYFRAPVDSFIFVPMRAASPLLVYNTKGISTGVMLPWVQCALMHDCIFPIGAQSGGCRFDKKPNYRYSGCHSYDVSALNIVLGLHFRYNVEAYSAKQATSSLFKEVAKEEAAKELALLLRDNTTESPSSRPHDQREV